MASRPRQPRGREGKEDKAGERERKKKKEKGKGRMEEEERREKGGWEKRGKDGRGGQGGVGGNMHESVKLSKSGTHRATGPGIMRVVPIEESAAFGATS